MIIFVSCLLVTNEKNRAKEIDNIQKDRLLKNIKNVIYYNKEIEGDDYGRKSL